jgi:hypothetical protein
MRYEFRAEVWLYAGQGGAWHFATLPAELGDSLRRMRGGRKGWGSIRVTAVVGQTSWRTSLFPEARTGSFLLPLKAEVRRREEIQAGQTRLFAVELEL